MNKWNILSSVAHNIKVTEFCSAVKMRTQMFNKLVVQKKSCSKKKKLSALAVSPPANEARHRRKPNLTKILELIIHI